MQPPTEPPALDEPLYEPFFGLREQPFALTSDPRFLFMGDGHRRAFDELLTGLKRREGLLLLTADTGMGKTTLCKAMLAALGPRTFSALIQNPYMSDAEVVRVILRDFGLVSREDIRKGAFGKADMPQLLDTLEQFLRSLIPLDSYAVVVIDEAQSLPARVIDQIRQLGSYEEDGQRLLQIVLSGQPGLAATLRTDAMKAVDGRISRRAVLGPLSPRNVEDYIKHRLTIAGSHDDVLFSAASAKAVADLANGVPRRINLLCDRALEEARLAGSKQVTAAMVRRGAKMVDGLDPGPPIDPADGDEEAAPKPVPLGRAIKYSPTFGYPDSVEPQPSPWRWVLIVGAVLLAAVLGYFVWSTMETRSVVPPPLPEDPPVLAVREPTPRPMPTDDDVRYIMGEVAKARAGGQ